ncbi:hypothetical protein [Amycolatopsis sp. WGS_07]|uniref:hypothetical protein n=1 Tax=Amycolatopsis sp. WGS_07 TaxID=3076764 RepID=UPI003872ED11
MDTPAAAPSQGWHLDSHGLRSWNGSAWKAHTLMLHTPAVESAAPAALLRLPEGVPPRPIATTAPATVTARALRATSFGNSWIEAISTKPDDRSPATIIAQRGRIGSNLYVSMTRSSTPASTGIRGGIGDCRHGLDGRKS